MVATWIRGLVLALVVLAAAPVPAAAQRAAEDFAIPNGYFYTQAAPGQNGAGYRVANEASIPFWDEFQRHGGLAKLGYPVIGRFIWKDRVAQLFQFAALVWLGGDRLSELRRVEELGEPPDHAKRAQPSPRSTGDAERYPWSGWWWPANFRAGGPFLFDPSGPLAKYDRYVESLGQPDPRTVEWERSELIFAGLQWAGHCNGWAAAALLEPEPTDSRIVNELTFGVADQKGLLSAYHFADAALWALGSEEQEVTPAELHRMLLSWLGRQRKGMIFTFRLGDEEVWSYPAFKFESVMGPDAIRPNVWLVRTVVWFVDNDVPAGWVGARPWPAADGKSFEYTLIGDPQEPTGGEWSAQNSGRFERPFMIWYPDPSRRNQDRQLSSPELDYRLIQRILGRSLPPVFTR